MVEIEQLFEVHKETVTNHGGVNGLTAWEAAASKTLAVTNNLAALEESVGNRAVVVRGNARDHQWHNLDFCCF